MIRPLSLRQSILLFLSAMLALVIGITFGIILPSIRRIQTLRRDVNAIQEHLEKQYLKAQHLRRSVRELPNISRLINSFAEAAIKPGEELRVITELETIADRHKVEQTLRIVTTPADLKASRSTTPPSSGSEAAAEKIDSSDNDRLSGKPYYQFSFITQGPFRNLINYLRAVEQLPYYLIIDQLQWERRKGDSTTSTPVILRFDGRIYVSSS